MHVSPRITRSNPHALAVCTALMLSSCGGGGGDETPAPASAVQPARVVDLTDLQIAQRLYAGSPRVPVGFSEDPAPTGYAHVATSHLKISDVSATSNGAQYELCTDDWNQALQWSETSAQGAPAYADLVATHDDARYFEFGRVRNGEPDFYLRDRVFKCGYVDRSGADVTLPEGPAGQLNRRPLTTDELRALSEYLWQFTAYNNFGHAVLKSSAATSTAPLVHSLIIATLTRKGVSASCDRIDVIAWRHRADTTSGTLELDVETLWSFGARELAGTADLCSA